jgi:phage terminase large subunit GpA-like protein
MLAAQVVNQAWSRGLQPPPRLTVSQWAQERRYVTAPSPEQGQWHNERTPYLVPVMDLLSPFSAARTIALEKGSQLGATEAGLNWTGYTIDVNPTSMMIVLPDQGTAKEWSGLRLDRLIEKTECLHGKIQDARKRDSGNSWQTKKFPNGFLKFTWASSAAKLRSTPAENLLLDEVDGFEGDVKGEGDPVTSLKRRFTNFPRGKMFMCSTPTLKSDSRIDREFQLGDQRYFFVRCPSCGWYQLISFDRLRCENDDPESVRMECVECGDRVPERFKTQMLAGGLFVATAGYDELRTRGFGKLEDVRAVMQEMEEAEEVSLHLSALYSPLGWYSWRTLMKQWFAANHPVKNLTVLKVLVNTIFGEVWSDPCDAINWELVRGRREEYRLGVAPMGVLFLTAGIDVQRDRIEIAIWGWGRGGQSWLVDYQIVDGSPELDLTWNAVDQVLAYQYPHESGARMSLSRIGIDTGDGRTIEFVYQWVKRQARSRVYAIKGEDHGPVISVPTHTEVTPRGKRRKWGIRIWHINVSHCKGTLYSYLQLPMPTEGEAFHPGHVHYPHMTDGWYKQLVAEEWKPGKKNRAGSWQLPPGARNEALDTWNYAWAMAHLEGPGIQNMDERSWQRYEADLRASAALNPAALQQNLFAPGADGEANIVVQPVCEVPKSAAPGSAATLPAAQAVPQTAPPVQAQKPESNPFLHGSTFLEPRDWFGAK